MLALIALMGLVLVLIFANVGDIGEQFVKCISHEVSATATIALFRDRGPTLGISFTQVPTRTSWPRQVEFKSRISIRLG